MTEEDEFTSVTPEVKKRFVALLSCTMKTGDRECEITYLISDLAVSLQQCVLGKADDLNLPEAMTGKNLWSL